MLIDFPEQATMIYHHASNMLMEVKMMKDKAQEKINKDLKEDSQRQDLIDQKKSLQ